MPLYEFACQSCGEHFEELATVDETPACPVCGASDPERLLSNISPPPRMGLRGAEARRSDSLRRAREEQRLQRRAQRRERETHGG